MIINFTQIIQKMEKNQKHVGSEKKITRKQAIKKAGVTALAASSFLLLNTNAQASASHNHASPGGRQQRGSGGSQQGGSGGRHQRGSSGTQQGGSGGRHQGGSGGR